MGMGKWYTIGVILLVCCLVSFTQGQVPKLPASLPKTTTLNNNTINNAVNTNNTQTIQTKPLLKSQQPQLENDQTQPQPQTLQQSSPSIPPQDNKNILQVISFIKNYYKDRTQSFTINDVYYKKTSDNTTLSYVLFIDVKYPFATFQYIIALQQEQGKQYQIVQEKFVNPTENLGWAMLRTLNGEKDKKKREELEGIFRKVYPNIVADTPNFVKIEVAQPYFAFTLGNKDGDVNKYLALYDLVKDALIIIGQNMKSAKAAVKPVDAAKAAPAAPVDGAKTPVESAKAAVDDSSTPIVQPAQFKQITSFQSQPDIIMLLTAIKLKYGIKSSLMQLSHLYRKISNTISYNLTLSIPYTKKSSITYYLQISKQAPLLPFTITQQNYLSKPQLKQQKLQKLEDKNQLILNMIENALLRDYADKVSGLKQLVQVSVYEMYFVFLFKKQKGALVEFSVEYDLVGDQVRILGVRDVMEAGK